MKKVTSTLTAVLLCLYVSAQVGSLETSTFNPPDGFVINNLSASKDDHGNSIAIQNDGKIVVAVVTTEDVFKIVRYLPDGTLDPAFGTGGIVSMNLTGTPTSVDACRSYAVGIQSTGKIVVGGYNWKFQDKDFVLARFDTDGTLDPTFGSPSTPGIVMTPVSPLNFSSYGEDEIRSLVILPDNSIIAAGYAYTGRYNDFAVAKYSGEGVLDGSFGSSGGYTITNVDNDNMVSGVAVNSTGEIFVVGTSNINSLTGDYAICRYTSGGTLTQTITSNISGIDAGNGIAIQSDDYILVTGTRPALLSTTTTDLFLARYKPDGTLDAGFGTGGIVTTNAGPGSSNDEGRSIAVQTNGKIIVAGTTDGNAGTSNDFLLVRYTSTGSPDGSFGTAGVSSAAISGQKDIGSAVKLNGNRIYVAGSANYTGSTTTNFALAAFVNDATGAPLPLVLSQFYAQKQTSKVVLQWQTASEEGVKQFVIERSNDGKSFKAIGTVAATGNSTITQKYSYADQSPFMSATNYYRLLMQDADGNFKYSKTLNIKFDGQLSTDMKVYPTFARDVLQVQLPDGMHGNVAIEIFDMNGRIVRRNNIASDGHALNTTVDVNTLVKGMYIIKASAGNTTAISRFTKQ